MIKPEGIPIAELEDVVSALDANVSPLSGLGQQFTDLGNNVHNTFQGLNGVYHAPERELLVNSTKKIQNNLGEFGPSLPAMSRHLTNLANEVRGRLSTLKEIRDQAYEWHRKKNGNPDWQNDQYMIDWNNRMVQDVRRIVNEEIPDLCFTCANAIVALHGGKPWDPKTGLREGQEPPPEQEQGDPEPEPWGSEEARDKPAWQDFVEFPGNFVVGVATVLVETVEGVLTLVPVLPLIGMIPAARDWAKETFNYDIPTWEDAGTAWKGVAVVAVDVLTSPTQLVWWGLDQIAGTDTRPDWVKDLGEQGVGMLKGFVAWDEWKTNPGKAYGMLFTNVVTTVGTGGAAGAVRAAAMAGKLGKLSNVVVKAAKVADLAKGVKIGLHDAALGALTKIPKVSAVVDGLSKIPVVGDNFKLHGAPKVDLPAVDTPHISSTADVNIPAPRASIEMPALQAGHTPSADPLGAQGSSPVSHADPGTPGSRLPAEPVTLAPGAHAGPGATPVGPVAPVPSPGSTSPGSTSPGSTSPGSTSPGSTSPGSTSPGSTSPGSTSPGSTTPGSTTPGSTTPGSTTPGSTTPGSTTPGSSPGSETGPGSTTPAGRTEPGSAAGSRNNEPGTTQPSEPHTPGATRPPETGPVRPGESTPATKADSPVAPVMPVHPGTPRTPEAPGNPARSIADRLDPKESIAERLDGGPVRPRATQSMADRLAGKEPTPEGVDPVSGRTPDGPRSDARGERAPDSQRPQTPRPAREPEQPVQPDRTSPRPQALHSRGDRAPEAPGHRAPGEPPSHGANQPHPTRGDDPTRPPWHDPNYDPGRPLAHDPNTVDRRQSPIREFGPTGRGNADDANNPVYDDLRIRQVELDQMKPDYVRPEANKPRSDVDPNMHIPPDWRDPRAGELVDGVGDSPVKNVRRWIHKINPDYGKSLHYSTNCADVSRVICEIFNGDRPRLAAGHRFKTGGHRDETLEWMGLKDVPRVQVPASAGSPPRPGSRPSRAAAGARCTEGSAARYPCQHRRDVHGCWWARLDCVRRYGRQHEVAGWTAVGGSAEAPRR